MNSILIIDDEKSVRYSFERMFEDEYDVVTAESGTAGLDQLHSGNKADIIFLDLKMPGMSGIDVLKEIKNISRKIPVVLMTAFGDSDTAIEAMKVGAFDYITKPFESHQLKEIIEKAMHSARIQEEAFCCGIESHVDGAETIVGKSRVILDVCKMIGQVAITDYPVLITGESGVGKELVARAIYNHSSRKGRPFMAVNCAALPEGVVESELFGSEKGAFTGAEKRRIGRFEQCDKGTLFLDEIGDMSMQTQAKLLRILQDGTYERLGSNETLKTDVRLIAASNRNLKEEAAKGRFRADLFHRLNVFSLHIPPLRERREDITELAEYILARAVKGSGKGIRGFSSDAVKYLISYNWPGNVRELENLVKRAVTVSKGDVIDTVDLKFTDSEPYRNELKNISDVIDGLFDIAVSTGDTEGLYNCILSNVEKKLIEKALRLTKGNQVKASNLLGITRVTLRKKIQEYNVPPV